MDKLNFEAIIGKTENSKEFRQFLQAMPEDPLIEHWFDGHFYIFHRTGLDVFVHKQNNQIDCVHLFTERGLLPSEFKRFTGEFANGVVFSDTAEDVLRKMGEPLAITIENMPPPIDKFDEMVAHAKKFKVNIQELFAKLRSYKYDLPDNIRWSFVFEVDGGAFYSAAVYRALKLRESSRR